MNLKIHKLFIRLLLHILKICDKIFFSTVLRNGAVFALGSMVLALEKIQG